MKKILCLFFILLTLIMSGCYDASQVEETAYLIAVGLDLQDEQTYSYTFQLAVPLAASGGEGEGGNPAGEQPEAEGGIIDSKNPTVKNIVIEAPDFYTAKNKLSNNLSKTLNMSHLKMIVCSEELSGADLKEHSELFLQEREIRPGTFVALSKGKAEQFLKAVNPDLESSTSKYYELSNSEKTLLYAPSVRLGDFLNANGTFDKSSVLPIAQVDKEKLSAELLGMAVFKEENLIGKLSGDEALLFNVLSGREKRFAFSVNDEKNTGDILSFHTNILKKPVFNITEKKENIKITTEIYLNMEFIGAKLPKGYENEQKLLLAGENELKRQIISLLIKTSREFSADILKIQRFYKKNFSTTYEMQRKNFHQKYKTAEFEVIMKRANKGGSTVSGEIN